MKPLLKLNGVDFSDCLKKFDYSLAYEKREGTNGGMMKDGSRIVDILAWKAVLKIKTDGLKPERVQELLTHLIADYVTVTFFDTRINGERTSEFIPSVVDVPISHFKDGVVNWYNSAQITLTER